MTTPRISLLIILFSLALGCGEAYASTLIDGGSQVKLDDALHVLSFFCATLTTAAGTMVALAYWAGSRFQKINDDIRSLRNEIAALGGILS